MNDLPVTNIPDLKVSADATGSPKHVHKPCEWKNGFFGWTCTHCKMLAETEDETYEIEAACERVAAENAPGERRGELPMT